MRAPPAAAASARLLLTLGDGDLSFSAALARSTSVDLLIATTFDSCDALLRKYGDAAAKSLAVLHSDELAARVRVLHHVNAAQVPTERVRRAAQQLGAPPHARFCQVLFHHPHCGVENAQRHRVLLAHFFASAAPLLCAGGTVHVSVSGAQAKRWQVLQQAHKAALHLVRAARFDEAQYRGYCVRRHQAARSFRHITRQRARLAQHSLELVFARDQDGVADRIDLPDVDDAAPPPLPSQPPPQPFTPSEFSCAPCERNFGDDVALQQHHAAKHGRDADIKPDWYVENALESAAAARRPNLLQCDVCQFWFESAHSYQQHLQELQPSEAVQLQCPHCDKRVADNRGLRQHLNFCQAAASTKSIHV